MRWATALAGRLLACALAVLAAKRKYPVASMTQLIAMLDYSDPGEIGVYLGRTFLDQRMKRSREVESSPARSFLGLLRA